MFISKEFKYYVSIMIKSIDKKYCTEKLVQLMPHTDSSYLIVSPDEIILLKIGDKVLINKYLNHPSRNLFPYHEKKEMEKILRNYLSIIKCI